MKIDPTLLMEIELGSRVADALLDENQHHGWAPKYDAIVTRAYEAQKLRRLGEFRLSSRPARKHAATD